MNSWYNDLTLLRKLFSLRRNRRKQTDTNFEVILSHLAKVRRIRKLFRPFQALIFGAGIGHPVLERVNNSPLRQSTNMLTI